MSSGKRPGATRKRRPVGVDADDRPEIGRLNFEAAAKVQFVSLDNSGLSGFSSAQTMPARTGRGHLHARRILIGRERARLLDRELRAVPIGVAGVAVEQHPQFVDPVEDFGLAEDVVRALDLAGAAEQLVQAQDRIVARMIGVVAGRAVDCRALVVAHGVIVGDRDRLVMGDEEAELRPRGRRP